MSYLQWTSWTTKAETALHKGLVEELLTRFEDTKGYRITGVDLEGYYQTREVKNEKQIGDGEDKQPDIDAFNDIEEVYVRGEAKTGEGDLGTLHSRTQFRLFSNRINTENNKASLFYIIVPKSKFDDLKEVLDDLGLLDKDNVIPVKSGKYH